MNVGISVRGNRQRRALAATAAMIYIVSFAPEAHSYAFNAIVPDVRQPASISGGSACPVRSHFRPNGAPRAVQWSTALGSSPVTIVTQDQTSSGRLGEIEQVITQSFAVWSGVSGSALQSVATSLTRTPTQSACGSDGVNSICFDQGDFAFTPGVLAFTRVIVADAVGVQVGSETPAVEVGEILDADIYFNPSDSSTSYATPLALPSSTRSYDLQSLLIHEIGHSLGFSHSAIWSAMMFPFAPVPGTWSGKRPSISQPDAPLGDDDRTGLRVLYPEASDTLHTGTIGGQIANANPLSLPSSPPGVTGVFGSQVVALDADSGAVVAATIGGWSCSAPGPAQFDGSYLLERLPIGHRYLVYAEPLNGAVDPSQIGNAVSSLCRNEVSDPGWPAQQAFVVPPADTTFTTRTRPSP
jgi:Matrixin